MSEAPTKFKRGDILRYAEGPTALFQYVSHHGTRIYGPHILGGTQSAYEDQCRLAGKHDIETWVKERGVTPDFDLMARDFTKRLEELSQWKTRFAGAAQVSRIREALSEMKRLMVATQSHPEVGRISHKEIIDWIRRELKAREPQDQAIINEVGMQLANTHNAVAMLKKLRNHVVSADNGNRVLMDRSIFEEVKYILDQYDE